MKLKNFKRIDKTLGIEFGSTRIKAVLVDLNNSILASGSFEWENELIENVWTYSEEDIWNGLAQCVSNLKENVLKKYNTVLQHISAIGVSGMMHGYIALNNKDEMLVPFRTWRNNNTKNASDSLSKLFECPIPQRWTIAHLYQAILNKEAHVDEICSLMTLSAYVHYKLTGNKVMGIGEASGVFPIDSITKDYNKNNINQFDELIKDNDFKWSIKNILPEALVAGAFAGKLTEKGAKLLDPEGDLKSGISFCPPEGDAGTGMVATNAIQPKTGNISAGTSVFSMIVLEKPLSKSYDTVDIVSTPTGETVAMVHVNNCTSDINSWATFIENILSYFGTEKTMDEIYQTMFESALDGDNTTGDLLTYNYFSGEHITGLTEGRPILIRNQNSVFSLSNLMKANIFSSIAVLRIGLDVLLEKEQVKINSIIGHGGLFKTPIVGQRFIASALETPIAVMETAGEGGSYGMAVLANYFNSGKNWNSLQEYLDNKVFNYSKVHTEEPDNRLTTDFKEYLSRYIKGLSVEHEAIKST